MPTHAEKRVLPYTPQQLFDLVADVEKYPAFLPWCLAVRVRKQETEGAVEISISDMVIGFKVFRERFTTRVTCTPGHRIDVAYEDGPFKYLSNHWTFTPLPGPDGAVFCEIDFFVDFEFRSKILQAAIGVVFNEAVQKMVNAFETRANALYGET